MEALGAAASIIAIIQLATQIANSIVIAGQLWEQVQNLPDEVRDMLSEMEVHGALFEEIEDELQLDGHTHFRNEQSARRILGMARLAYKALHNLIEDMNTRINSKKGIRKKVTLVKITLKKDTLEQYQKKLARSSELLQMTLQVYQMAIIRQSPGLISKQIMTDMMPYLKQMKDTKRCADGDEQDSEDEERLGRNATENKSLVRRSKMLPNTTRSYAPSKLGRFALASRSSTGAWKAYLQWPSWLSQSVFEFDSRPSLAGWTYSYRIYNVIPYKSEIMRRVQAGDKPGVLELFRTRQASPFDRDEDGSSLLHHAARSKKYEMCQLLLNFGLQECLVEGAHESPVAQFVFWPNNANRQDETTAVEDHWERIVTLFHSHLEDPESNLVLQLFDYLQEWAMGDEFITTFRKRFLPKWYPGPLRNRLEAFRLGSFIVKSQSTLLSLLTDNNEVTASDVQASTHDRLSLVHSMAIALGSRFADVNLPYRRAWLQGPKYHEGWSRLVQKVVMVSHPEDLHCIETITPWDTHQVPIWRGTPLVSVIGGVLCYISPDISFTHWDTAFQLTLQQWVSDLQQAGVDLIDYGQHERQLLKTHMRGALDADAINSSRSVVRNVISRGVETLRGLRVGRDQEEGYNENHWVPIRMLDLIFGPSPADWRIIWAPEFEWMANQFWDLIDRESMIMPGSWVDG
ncbi:hypothetical protein BGZ63DRAFT_206122 [Mariannaea sp. PMI_226]|nr:hypothetical protein BGZ63DRAFT_206122 [Mariannaea sp. PMI_226]